MIKTPCTVCSSIIQGVPKSECSMSKMTTFCSYKRSSNNSSWGNYSHLKKPLWWWFFQNNSETSWDTFMKFGTDLSLISSISHYKRNFSQLWRKRLSNWKIWNIRVFSKLRYSWFILINKMLNFLVKPFKNNIIYVEDRESKINFDAALFNERVKAQTSYNKFFSTSPLLPELECR